MSVMAPRDRPMGRESARRRFPRVNVDAWTLCAEFIERIVSEAQAAAARGNPGSPAPEVDWEQIWRAGDGAPSDESAIGRIIQAASGVARRMAPRTSQPPAELSRADGEFKPEAGPEW